MRLHDWPDRLAAAIEAAEGRPFVHGVHDCCLFACDCIAAVTGRDPGAAWRGAYHSQSGGLALMKSRTLLGLPREIGLARVAPAFAWRGDIALAPIGQPSSGRAPKPMILVVDGAWLRGPCGAAAPRDLALRTWRVE